MPRCSKCKYCDWDGFCFMDLSIEGKGGFAYCRYSAKTLEMHCSLVHDDMSKYFESVVKIIEELEEIND